MKNTATFTIFEEDDDDLETMTMYTDKQNEEEVSDTAAEIERRLADVERLMANLSLPNAALQAKLSVMRQELERTKTREIESCRATQQKTNTIELAVREQQVRDVLRRVNNAETVDLAFIMDGTSSMQSFIDDAKQSIRSVVNQVRKTNPGLTLRIGIIVYRDVNDRDRFECLPFSTEMEVFESFLGKIRAVGGDDAPEDLAGGVQRANYSLVWTSPTRVAFIIADAPCHGIDYHDLGDDMYPEGTPGVNILNEFEKLQGTVHPRGTMTLCFGKITEHTDKMVQRLTEQGIQLECVDLKDEKSLKHAATAGIRESIFKTFTATGGAGVARPRRKAPLKSYAVVSRVPSQDEWKKSRVSPVHVFHNKPVKKIADLQAPLTVGKMSFGKPRTDKTKKSSMYIRYASSPFAEGETRIAFHGQLARNPEDLDLVDSTMVMKSFKHLGKRLNNCERYLKQMEVSNIARFLAGEYNKSRLAHCAPIHVLRVCVVEEVEDANEGTGNRRFCAEELLPGTEFTKYSNNTGYWKEEVLDESLVRFTKFSLEATNGYLMVTDLQGVKHDGSYYLTDPVLLCTNILRFGETNLGEKFMEKCIASTNAIMEENGWD